MEEVSTGGTTPHTCSVFTVHKRDSTTTTSEMHATTKGTTMLYNCNDNYILYVKHIHTGVSCKGKKGH